MPLFAPGCTAENWQNPPVQSPLDPAQGFPMGNLPISGPVLGARCGCRSTGFAGGKCYCCADLGIRINLGPIEEHPFGQQYAGERCRRSSHQQVDPIAAGRRPPFCYFDGGGNHTLPAPIYATHRCLRYRKKLYRCTPDGVVLPYRYNWAGPPPYHSSFNVKEHRRWHRLRVN